MNYIVFLPEGFLCKSSSLKIKIVEIQGDRPLRCNSLTGPIFTWPADQGAFLGGVRACS